MVDDDLDEKLEMVKDFVTESRELLDDVEPQIIAMEKNAASSGKVDEEILNTIFRLFHTLKGTASFLDLQTVISVTHEMETLLDIFRKGRAVVGSRHVDLLYRTSDFIRNILDTVEQKLTDEGWETGAEVIIGDLKKSIASISGSQGSQPEQENSPKGPDGGESCENRVEREYTPSANLEEMSLAITPEMIRRFTEEALELCEEAEASLLDLEKTPLAEYAGQAFRAFHSFKGNAGFFGYSDLERVSHLAEAVLDGIRSGERKSHPATISALLAVIDVLRAGVRGINQGEGGDIPDKDRIIDLLCELASHEEAQSPEGPDETGDPGSLIALEQDLISGEIAVAGEIPETGRPLENGGKKECGGADRQAAGQQQVIRVDIEKLDKLLDLVGELVIAEAMVSNNQSIKGQNVDRFEKALMQLDKITRDIQEVSMSMRMIPLAGTFRKMVRLVRDLAQKENKKVNLQIVGEETEVDKTIIEQISDPLVHIIRNAVDHGLESPEERRSAGKPETGLIKIEAKHSAGEVWIIVEDDGRGLNREKILKKGVQRGLIKGEDRDMKDEEVWRLIFEPGFSTADKVSNISGRGVGMDVVHRNIEKLRGKVDIRSRAGVGTIFAVRIPLTLAIIEGMVVKVGQNRYTIPIISIKESFQPRGDQITRTPDRLEVVRIRGELLPVIRLHEMYGVQSRYQHLTQGILIVVENDDKKCCLFVDELIGQQQIVIKGLSSYLGQARSISGCAILGDGDISMILDISSLIKIAESVAV